MLIYEGNFGLKDYFLLSSIAIIYGIVYIMPKRFSISTSLLLFIYSSNAASMLDNSIGGGPIDLYDIMGGPAYSVMDFVVYFLYAPFGYFFIYFYDKFHFKGMKTAGYIVLCSLIALAFEWICIQVGIFQYKDSYLIYYSFCIYLFSQTSIILFYRYISKTENDR
ncbi:hypothetical protein ACFQZT_03515 [Paenibacillus sp. GCM10027628]|uniref:hypothetical protein n=1 Tax=Paenibacillus sp. GCM10027628 TaxID=3273413 RepID=UPI0036332461